MKIKEVSKLRRYAFAVAVLAILLGVLVAGCTGSTNTTVGTAATDSKHISKLVVGLNQEIFELSAFDDTLICPIMWEYTHNGLIKYDNNFTAVPVMAESWETSDSKTWTFHLRNNTYWHDGVPVTSHDVKFSCDFNEKCYPEWCYQNYESIETPDNYTIIFHLKTPDYYFLKVPVESTTLFPEHIFKDVADPKTIIGTQALIGTGPYKVESFDKTSGVLTLKAFDKYYAGKPAIDTIEIHTYKNDYSMIMALENGEIDITDSYPRGISYYYVPGLLKSGNISILTARSGTMGNALWLNINHTPLDNKDFRQALSYAINYDEVLNLFTAGYGAIPDAGWIPEGYFPWVETRKLSYDVNKSKSLLDAAGYKDTDGDGYRELPSGEKFALSVVYRSNKPDHVRVAEVIKKYFNAVGVNVNLKPLDANTFGKVMDAEKSFDVSVSGTGFGFAAGSDDAALGLGYIQNWCMAKTDTQFMKYLDDLQTIYDKGQRKAIEEDMQRYFADQMFVIPLYTSDFILPYDNKYEGYTFNPYYGTMNNVTFYGLHKA